MTEAIETTETTSFGKDLAKDMGKAAAINAAAIAGVFGGLIAVGAVLDWQKNRRAKKAAQTEQAISTTE